MQIHRFKPFVEFHNKIYIHLIYKPNFIHTSRINRGQGKLPQTSSGLKTNDLKTHTC